MVTKNTSPARRGHSPSKKKTPVKTATTTRTRRGGGGGGSGSKGGAKTKLAAAAQKKRLEERGSANHCKPSDVPIVRGNSVTAQAFRQSCCKNSTGWKKWDKVTRQAVEEFDGTWPDDNSDPYADAKVFGFILRKMGKSTRFMTTNGNNNDSGSKGRKGGTHVWFEMSQEQIITACRNKFNRIVAEENDDDDDDDDVADHSNVDMMETDGPAESTSEKGGAKGKKAAAKKKVMPPRGEESAGEPTAESGKKKAAAVATDTVMTKEEAAAAAAAAAAATAQVPQEPTFFNRVRGLFGWGG